jgi:hypothetical protein
LIPEFDRLIIDASATAQQTGEGGVEASSKADERSAS